MLQGVQHDPRPGPSVAQVVRLAVRCMILPTDVGEDMTQSSPHIHTQQDGMLAPIPGAVLVPPVHHGEGFVGDGYAGYSA